MATIRRRGDRYQVQVRRQGCKGISRTFYQLKDAQAWARQAEAQADRHGLGTDRNSLRKTTLAALVVRYRDDVVPSKKGARDETIVLNAFLKHPICKKTLSNITSADFASYRDERLCHVSTATVKRQLNPIRHMFEIARDEWDLPIRENPLDKVKLKTIDNRRERRLKDGELELILEAASSRRNPYIIPIILFALETAMRRGEILSLCWNHIDWERRSVTLPDTKNGHSRTIPLTPAAYEITCAIANATCALVQGNPRDRGGKERVFPTTANAVRLLWQRITKAAGIEDLHFHDLRHEAISRFFELGLTVPEVASISGHRDARMLLRYAHAQTKVVQEKLRQVG